MPMNFDGTNGLTFNDGTQIGSANSLGMRNRIINGDMRIDQRNNGAAVTANVAGVFGADRNMFFATGTPNFSVQQVVDGPPGGSYYSTKVTVLTSGTPATTDVNIFQQRIEGNNVSDLALGTSAAKTTVASFWFKCSVVGSFSLFARSGSTTSFLSLFTCVTANTWQYVTVVIPGTAIGTGWDKTSFIGFRIGISFGGGANSNSTAGVWTAGTDFFGVTGQTNLLANAGATFNFTDLQLEAGSVATPFERRPIGLELALCQRYLNTAILFVPAGASSMPLSALFPVEMRAVPTVTGGGAGFSGVFTSRTIQFATQTSQASQTLAFAAEL